MGAVAIVKCADYEMGRVQAAIQWGLRMLDFERPAGPVLLKPNVLIGRPPESGVCTHPAVLRALLGLWPNAVYGDSPAARTPQDANMELAGYPLARWVPLEHPTPVRVPEPLIAPEVAIARVVAEAETVVSVCKLKTHGYMHLTGAIKNQFGCLVGRAKTRIHNLYPRTDDFARLLCDITKAVRPKLYIMDAIDAMEGNGPFHGTVKRLGYLLFSRDPVSLDAAACDLIDMPYDSVPTLRWGEAAGLGTIDHRCIGDEWTADSDFRCNRNPPADMTRGAFERWVNVLTADHPQIDGGKCVRCGHCVEACPAQPAAVKPPRIDLARCLRCFCCQEVCPAGAITIRAPLLSRAVRAYRTMRRGH